MRVLSPELARKESERQILDALEQGPKTWSELERSTHLSTRTLQKRLEQLEKRRIVKRQLKARPGQRSRVYYVLSEKGYEEIPILNKEIFSSFAKAAKGFGKVMETYFRFVTGASIIGSFPGCLSFRLDYKEPIKNREAITKRIELLLAYLLTELIEDPESLEGITDRWIDLRFRYNGSEIRKYLETVEKERQEAPVALSLEEMLEEEVEKLNLKK